MKSKLEGVLWEANKGVYILSGTLEIEDHGKTLTDEDHLTVVELTPNKGSFKLHIIEDFYPLSMFKEHPKFHEVHVHPEFDLVTAHHREIWRKGDCSHMLIRPAQRFKNEDSTISRFVVFSVIDNPKVLFNMPLHQILRGEGNIQEGINLGINPLEGDLMLANSFKGDSAISKLRDLPRYSLNAGQLYHLDTSLQLDAYRTLLKSNVELATTLGHFSEETKSSLLGIPSPVQPDYAAYLSHLHSRGVLSDSTHISSQADRQHRDKISRDYLANLY